MEESFIRYSLTVGDESVFTKTLYCSLRKSTRHRSDSNIKYMNILLAGKDSSDSSTKDDNFINVKKEESLESRKTSSVFPISSLLLRTFSGLMFQTKK